MRRAGAALVSLPRAAGPSCTSDSSMMVLTVALLQQQATIKLYSPYDNLRKRPAQSPAERKRDEEIVFPKTLKSGRFENKSTVSQKLYQGPPVEGNSAPDRRFFRPLQDYTEVQDNDPYAKLFGESKETSKVRVKTWQHQFETENAEVELPYERDTLLKRSAPNWFVRYFINMRDTGGLDHAWHLLGIGGLVMMLIVWITYSFYTAPSKAKPTSEIR